jgi:hypothetical protein
MAKEESKKPADKPAQPKDPLGVLQIPQHPTQKAVRIGKRERKEKK